MRRPLGCLTFSALVAVVLVLAGIAAAAIATANGIFSPGQLSSVAHGGPLGGVTSHVELAGRCDACHTAGWSGERMADRCLACHTQVQQELSSASGLHGRIATAATCRSCHTDHRGPTASLTLADPSTFPHERTGYVLRAHALGAAGGSVTCRDCHPGTPATFSPPACIPCHQSLDPTRLSLHQQTFGTACLNCHDGIDTYGKAFQHVLYPLVGRHDGAACGGCHQGAATLATLRSAPTACVTCHAAKDIHGGRLGTSCADCHAPAGWTGATIDHDRTRYPLVGMHVGVSCASCHVGGQWTGIGLSCASCHASDNPHGSRFPADCASCHSPSGWKDVTFSHAQAGFALDGAHATIACAACHPNGRFAGTPATCYGCHAASDRHNGSFGQACAGCHNTTTWADATFDHAKSGFPLTGAHQALSCQRCHTAGVFKGTPTTCSACHTAPSSHVVGFGSSCGSCHSTGAWSPASFNAPHRFPLGHGGAGGVCASCHPGSFAAYSCASCHGLADMASRHSGVPGYSTSCLKCHPTGSSGG